MKPSASPRLLVGAALTATILLRGTAFAAIREALPSFGPSALASGRLLLAALAFGVIALFTHARLPAGVASSSLLMIGPSGVLMGWVWLGEQPAPLALAGGAIALAGVAIVVVRGPRPRLPILVRTPTPQHA